MGGMKVPFTVWARFYGWAVIYRAERLFRGDKAASSKAQRQNLATLAIFVVILAFLTHAQSTSAKEERERLERELASGRISMPPGYLLLTIAEFLFSTRSLGEVLQPTIQDMRVEYYDALSNSRPWKAKWVRVRGTWAFLNAAGLIVLGSFGKIFVRVWKLIG